MRIGHRLVQVPCGPHRVPVELVYVVHGSIWQPEDFEFAVWDQAISPGYLVNLNLDQVERVLSDARALVLRAICLEVQR